MKPIILSHQDYQTFVMKQLQKHHTSGVLILVSSDWPVITKLWITDLSKMTTLLTPYYGNRKPKPRNPTSMIRSYLLLLLTNPTMSLAEWGDMFRRIPLYTSGKPRGEIIKEYELTLSSFGKWVSQLNKRS